MRLVRVLAGLCVLALAFRVPLASAAQHAGGGAHAAGSAHPSARPAGVGTPHAPIGGHPASISPPPAGVHIQRGIVGSWGPTQTKPAWRFPEIAPTPNLRIRNLGSVDQWPRHWILRPGFDLSAERFRRFRYYQVPFFFFPGAGQPICNPFLPGYFGPQLWYDNEFPCFGTPFFGVNF